MRSNVAASGEFNPLIGPAKLLPLFAKPASVPLPAFTTQTLPEVSMASAPGPLRFVENGLPLRGAPWELSLERRLDPVMLQALPEASIAIPLAEAVAPLLKLMATVQSLGATDNAGWNGGDPPATPNNNATFVPGCSAMLSAASNEFEGEPCR